MRTLLLDFQATTLYEVWLSRQAAISIMLIAGVMFEHEGDPKSGQWFERAEQAAKKQGKLSGLLVRLITDPSFVDYADVRRDTLIRSIISQFENWS